MYNLTAKFGLTMVGLLDYETLGHNATFTLDDWATSVRKAALAYPTITYWEIWNEPTLAKYHLGYMDGTPQHYVALLRVAYQTLKAVNQRNTVIALGGDQLGIAGDLAFAKAVFALDGGQHMDAISVHAYPYYPITDQPWEYYRQVWAKDLTELTTFNKPIWVTETGIESASNETDQATFLKNDFLFLQQERAVAFIWYTMIDYYENGTIVTFGLLRIDETAKPSFTTYSELAEFRSLPFQAFTGLADVYKRGGTAPDLVAKLNAAINLIQQAQIKWNSGDGAGAAALEEQARTQMTAVIGKVPVAQQDADRVPQSRTFTMLLLIPIFVIVSTFIFYVALRTWRTYEKLKLYEMTIIEKKET
jgi:hypothetical protein